MITINEIKQRFDIDAFVMPPEYIEDTENKDKESKLLLCRLFIDCFKVLTYEEFNALQGALIVSQCWDSRPNPPVHVNGGFYRSCDPEPLTLTILSKTINADKDKLSVLLKSAFSKIPLLKTFLDMAIVEEIEHFPTMELKDSNKFKIEQEQFKKLGDSIRKGIIRKADMMLYASDYKRR